MGVVSGKDLAIDGVQTVSSWKIQVPGEPAEWLSSGNQGAYGRQAGIKDWRGMYTQYSVVPDYWPGDEFTLTASINESVGATGDVMVDGIRVVWDQAKAKKIRCDTFFSSNGDLTLGAAVATDAVQPWPVGSVGKAIQVAVGEAALATEDDVAEMELYLFRRNPKYSGSSTPGYYRRTVGDLDGQVKWKRWTDTPSGLYSPFDTVQIKMFTTATDDASPGYYLIKYGVLDLLDDFGADHWSEDPVGATMRASFTGFYGTLLGSIDYVAGSGAGVDVAIWPPA